MNLSPLQTRVLGAMDIDIWRDRRAPPVETAPQQASPEALAEVPAPRGWQALQRQVAVCTRCDLHHGRTQTVFGVGDAAADWMIIGEAPGAEEDRQGEPFVGRAGKLLNEMLRAVGLSRRDVFIANILKCRPPDNRDPRPDEIAACADYLAAQVAAVAPRMILAVGRVAAQNLLGSDSTLGRLRGRVHHFGAASTPVVVTYHPAYLLRSPTQKGKAWQDLCLAMQTLETSA